jgi:hypothetical protein
MPQPHRAAKPTEEDRMAKIRWATAKCPVCGEDYAYIEGGYKPKTCNKLTCLHKYLHYPIYQGVKSK